MGSERSVSRSECVHIDTLERIERGLIGTYRLWIFPVIGGPTS
jgi:hypothetical protein